MNPKALLFIFLFITPSNDWELKKSKGNIEVYTRRIDSSDFKELKCKTTVKSSLSAIVKVLTDVDHYTKWIYKCVKANTVKKINDAEVCSYQLFDAPWPLDDRDVVAVVKVIQDKHTKVVTVRSGLADNLVPEKSGVVRIRKFHTTYTLIPKGKGMVEINYELGTEPGGSIPAWLANLVMVNGPYSTQQMMNELIQKPFFKNARFDFISEP